MIFKIHRNYKKNMRSPSPHLIFFLALLCAAAAAVAVVGGDRVTGSVRCSEDKGGCVFAAGIDRTAQSWGWYSNTVNNSGWATLTAVANPTLVCARGSEDGKAEEGG